MTGKEFEAEVFSVARAMWPEAASAGPVIRQGRERDGEFETRDITHLVECTIETSQKKAKQDIEKLRKRIAYLERGDSSRLYKGWFVTLHEPSAHQREVAEKCPKPVEAISFREFRRRLVDADAYLAARSDYPFGSMRDPHTNDYRLSHGYVGLEYVDRSDRGKSFEEVLEEFREGGRLVLLGDYGVGKSTTCSELFKRLKTAFVKQEHPRFPVVLNLRDHHAQTDPAEALLRHAQNLGYPSALDLVRAWRAGYIDLILDGFDEIAVVGWAGGGRQLKTIRYRSMELIRRFIRDSPSRIGILVSGRAHYFDNRTELKLALETGTSFAEYRIEELSDEAVSEFLKAIGWERGVPEWVPTRPLLLGYLAAHGILDSVVDEGDLSPAAGWHNLLTRIAEREAKLEAGIAPDQIRRIIEEAAILARSANDGLGQLSPSEIVGVFKRICGYEPDDRGSAILQRLPGLGAHQTEDGTRVFVDRDFANAAAGSALGRFVQSPYDWPWSPSDWLYGLSPLGLEVAALQASDLGLVGGHVQAAIDAARKEVEHSNVLAADLVALAGLEGHDVEHTVVIDSVWIPELPFYVFDADLSRVVIRDSIISEIEIPGGTARGNLPRFERCQVSMVAGCSGERHLPEGKFAECEFEDFEEAARTTSALLELEMPIGCTVGLTVLKKLFRQSGSGRREGALSRGLGQAEKEIVPDVLDVIRQYDFAVPSKQGSYTVWLPTKRGNVRARVREILDDPRGSTDPILTALKGI